MDVKMGISGFLGKKYWLSMGWAIPSWDGNSSLLRGLLFITQKTRIPMDGGGFPIKAGTARCPGALSSMAQQEGSL